jgi:transcription elongation factor GreB
LADKNYITPAGYKRLIDELTELATQERPKVVREVADAAAEGDRSENAAYIYGKRRLREIDRRMGFIKKRMRFMQVVQPEHKDRVFFGAYVEVEDDDEGESRTFQIVGIDEVDASAGRISWQSPVGRALLGKKVDDEVTVVLPEGRRSLVVCAIRYDAPVDVISEPSKGSEPPAKGHLGTASVSRRVVKEPPKDAAQTRRPGRARRENPPRRRP